MSHLMSQFISLNLNSSKSIVAANGDSMPLARIGSVDIPFVSLSDVYYISSLTMNLASVNKICDSGCDVKFSVSDSLGKLDAHDICDCSGHKLSKFSALSFNNSVCSSNAPFDLVHSDVWRPSLVSTKGEFRALVKTQHSIVIKCFRCDLEGYGVSQKGYRCYDPVSQKLHASLHVDFLEHIPYYSVPASSHNLTQYELINVDPFKDFSEEPTPIVSFASFISFVHNLHEPESYTKAVCDPLRQGAMDEELTTFYRLTRGTCHHDSILFVKVLSTRRILLSLYVDDMITIGDDCDGIELLKAEFSHRFVMKDLGLLCYFVGIEVGLSPKGYLLSQSKYIANLFDHARMTDNKIANIPIYGKAKYTSIDGDP
ncbi:uncharacterized mitochondrial protein-like protein [Tanacetum coccineum]